MNKVTKICPQIETIKDFNLDFTLCLLGFCNRSLYEFRAIMSDHAGFNKGLNDIGKNSYRDYREFGDY